MTVEKNITDQIAYISNQLKNKKDFLKKEGHLKKLSEKDFEKIEITIKKCILMLNKMLYENKIDEDYIKIIFTNLVYLNTIIRDTKKNNDLENSYKPSDKLETTVTNFVNNENYEIWENFINEISKFYKKPIK